MTLSSFIKDISPPFFLRFARNIIKSHVDGSYFERGFNTWSEASRKASYNSKTIFNKTLKAARLVRDGKAAYERDSVLFDKVQYDFKLLSSLLLIANIQNRLNLIDFGGSLGTSYRQNKKFLDCLKIQKRWVVIEQSEYVRIGKNEFTTGTLDFLESLSEIDFDVDVVLFGSSLCYIENAYRILDQVKSLSPKFILIVRTPFSDGNNDTIWIQNVSKSIYDASYPLWIFSESKLLSYLEDSYELFEVWDDDFQAYDEMSAKGFLFRKTK